MSGEQTQIRVLTPVAGSDYYSGRWITGRVLRGFRGRLVSDGASSPSGNTAFDVPANTVRVGEILVLRGQYFKAIGLEPQPPFWIRHRITTRQVPGRFREDPFQRISHEGVEISHEGDYVVVEV